METIYKFDDIIVKDNFFELTTVNHVFDYCQSLPNGKDFIDNVGIFKGLRIARQLRLHDLSDKNLSYILNKTLSVFNNVAEITQVAYVQLYLPWDIHCDLIRQDSTSPFYNVLIPLQDADSSTIVFNQQSSNYNEFYKYKATHPKEINPIDQTVWDQYLSMCWAEDRDWLSIKQILPKQRAGQLIAFKRNFFHSSDSFHLRQSTPKHFLQVILDKKI